MVKKASGRKTRRGKKSTGGQARGAPRRDSRALSGLRTAAASKAIRAGAVPPPEPIEIDPPRPNVTASLTVRAGAGAIAAASADAAAAGGAASPPQTVIYVHGIGNKPEQAILKCQWDKALFGMEMGDRSRMAYWVDRARYRMSEDATCSDPDRTATEDDEATTSTILALSRGRSEEHVDTIEQEIDALVDSEGSAVDAAQSEAQADFLRAVAARMESVPAPDAVPASPGELRAKILPLPRRWRDRIVSSVTRVALRDVNDFFFVLERRRAMLESLRERLSAGGGPFVIVAHSQGSMIAYEVLRHLTKDDCDVRLLVTIGSPLGLQEVQDVFRSWTGTAGNGLLPKPECVTSWLNVAEMIDPVAFDSDLTDEFADIDNIRRPFLNLDSPWDPHSGTGYLRTEHVRKAVRAVVGNAFAQRVGQMVITRDLVDELENGQSGDRHKTLIELRTTDADTVIGDLSRVADRVIGAINDMAGDEEVTRIERMRRFVAADLTRNEVERLRTRFAELNIQRVWRNMEKRALIHTSTHVVQAKPAILGYGATGRNIGWAVLDTGIRGDHPHFEKHQNIGPQWDCTGFGAPTECTVGSDAWKELDGNGHGTHVAGVIAGTLENVADATDRKFHMEGMAPQAKLYGFKVLTDDGRGHDSFIIKALDKIAEINESSSQLAIHGVNLSLGGTFDPSIYGCGHTPLCQELRRLWRQGVLVCLAAGNEGYAMLQSDAGFIQANVDLSIGDPANLEEAVAVGSIHKENPHTFGISYFSSRGPTADGRRKPDVVAPGESILSAFHAWPGGNGLEDLYIEMSGTSMATPHVSGILAAFLSIRREFIGFPDRVKAMLLEGCTDLRRDPYMQGAGMPNLIKMLLHS